MLLLHLNTHCLTHFFLSIWQVHSPDKYFIFFWNKNIRIIIYFNKKHFYPGIIIYFNEKHFNPVKFFSFAWKLQHTNQTHWPRRDRRLCFYAWHWCWCPCIQCWLDAFHAIFCMEPCHWHTIGALLYKDRHNLREIRFYIIIFINLIQLVLLPFDNKENI